MTRAFFSSSPASLSPVLLALALALPLLLPAAAGCSRPAAVNADATARALGDLNDAAPEIRLRAVEELGRQRVEAAVRPLCRCLRDIRLDVRKAAAWALGEIKSPAAIGPLGATLSAAGEDPELRKMAAEALGQIGDPAAVPVLAATLKDADEGVVYAAAYALANTGGEAAFGELVAATRGENLTARRAAVNVLGNAASPAVVTRLRELLGDPDPVLRLAAGERLVRLRDTNSYAAVVGMLLDPDPTVRWGIRPSVAGLGTDAPMDALCRILSIQTGTVAATDAEGKTVPVPTEDAKETARALALSFTGPAVIQPVLVLASARKSGLGDDLTGRLKAQMGDPAFRAELCRRMVSGGPMEQQMGLQVLADTFTDARPADRLPDGDMIADSCARLLQSGDSGVRYRAARVLCLAGDNRGRKELLARFWSAVDTLKAAWTVAEKEWSAQDKEVDPAALRKAEDERIRRQIEKAKRDGRNPTDRAVRRLAKERASPEQMAAGRRIAFLSKATPDEPIATAVGCVSALERVCDKALVDDLRRALDAGDSRIEPWARVLAYIVRMMGRIGDPAYADPLLNLMLMDQKSSTLVGSLAGALGRLKVAAAFDPIADIVVPMRVDQYFLWLRGPCYEGLYGCDPARAVDVVGPVLTNMPAHQAESLVMTAQAMGAHPAAGAVPYLMVWVNHDLKTVREAVQAAIVQVGRSDLDWLIAGFDVPDEPRRSALAGVIADGFGRDAVPRLLSALAGDNPRLRQGAVWTLACVGSPEAVDAARRGLADAHPGVRSAAAWSVGRLRAGELAPDLVKLLADPDEAVRAMAAKQLGVVGAAETVQPLVVALGDKAPSVRAQAALSLGALNVADALPALDKLAGQDPDPDVSTAAKLAAARIRGLAAQPVR